MRFCVFLENDKTDLRQIFFQGLENTSLQSALKIMHPAFNVIGLALYFYSHLSLISALFIELSYS